MTTCINFGAGVNSTALIVEAVRRGIQIDRIWFADTGDERLRTYSYLAIMDAWLVAHGQPSITVLRWVRKRGVWAGRFVTISEAALAREELPSKAYGLAGCTSKWKQQPIDAAARLYAAEVGHLERWLGYDAGEDRRAVSLAREHTEPWTWRAPLIEWDMDRADCRAAIAAAGLPDPGKSSCFLCPSMKPAEIRELEREEPERLALALEIEARAVPHLRPDSAVRGLGGSLRWSEVLAQPELFDAGLPRPVAPCAYCDGAL